MREPIDELRQRALICANEIKRLNSEESVANAAYARAKTLAGAICPDCCVKDGLNIKLEEDVGANATSLYRCNNCDFYGAFSKSDQK